MRDAVVTILKLLPGGGGVQIKTGFGIDIVEILTISKSYSFLQKNARNTGVGPPALE